MTEHDLKEMKNLGAELGAAKAEVERLRGMLREAVHCCPDEQLRNEMKAALSQQAEPAECPVCCSDEPHTGTCGSSDPRALCNRAKAEPAPAQDERELCPSCHGSGSSGGRMHCNAAGDSEYEAFRCESCDGFGTHLTRPAQTEQQPVAWRLSLPDGRTTLEAAYPSWADGGDGYSIQPLYAAPIAQTATQPEQSGLAEALEAIVRQYPNPDISHVDYRVHACKQAEHALEAYRAATTTQTAPQGKFAIGDRVKKTSGSGWVGHVCGTYSTALTPEGYAVESEAHAGSVQIYPAKALEAVE